jgi:Protein of unknown function (DUF551)
MKDIPETIYLQWEPDPGPDGCTWCQDRINDDDVEYHRAPAWISVEDRLPELGESVLIWDGQCRRVGFYLKTGEYYYYWESTDDEYPLDITHWMPLPEPPETEE